MGRIISIMYSTVQLVVTLCVFFRSALSTGPS
jgi:hypothetical protein